MLASPLDTEVPLRAKPLSPELAELKREVLDAAFRVHTRVGAGYQEHVYRSCLAHDLRLAGLDVDEEVWCGIEYRGLRIPQARRLDLDVARQIVVEVKAVESLAPIHKYQVISYLRATGRPLGLLVNFGAARLKDGGYDWFRHPDLLEPVPDRRILGAEVGVRDPSPEKEGTDRTEPRN